MVSVRWAFSSEVVIHSSEWVNKGELHGSTTCYDPVGIMYWGVCLIHESHDFASVVHHDIQIKELTCKYNVINEMR